MGLRDCQQREPLLLLLGKVLGPNMNCFLKGRSGYEPLRITDLEKQSELL